jgi:hypothetical protein
MMTKKDHRVIAEATANTRRYFLERIKNGEKEEINLVLDKVMADLVFYLKKDNAAFSLDRFIDAVRTLTTDSAEPTHLHHLEQVMRPAGDN